jgi:predicted RNA polymerase sigma factor
LQLVNEGLVKFRTFFKLWLIKAHILEELNKLDDARKTYEEAL